MEKKKLLQHFDQSAVNETMT